MKERYTEQELQYIRDHYSEDGYVAVANQLGRTTASVRTKARELGVTKRYRMQMREVSDQHRELGTYRHKPNYFVNESPDTLQDKIAENAERDKDKVMLKVSANTWIQVPRHKATKEYAAQVLHKWDKNRRDYH